MRCTKKKSKLVSQLTSYPVSRLNRQTGKQANRQTKNGFTLIELLIVTALLAVISLSIYATFNSGVKIWQRVNKQIPEEDLDIFFEKFALDLRNSFKFNGLNFLGEEKRLEFSTLVNPVRDRPPLGGRLLLPVISNGVNSPGINKKTVGKAIYLYDSESKIIKRTLLDFSQIYNGEEGTTQQVLKNVKLLKFRYYLYDKEKKEYLWQDEWLKEDLPLAVRIELDVVDGAQINKFIKTVSIPVSS